MNKRAMRKYVRILLLLGIGILVFSSCAWAEERLAPRRIRTPLIQRRDKPRDRGLSEFKPESKPARLNRRHQRQGSGANPRVKGGPSRSSAPVSDTSGQTSGQTPVQWEGNVYNIPNNELIPYNPNKNMVLYPNVIVIDFEGGNWLVDVNQLRQDSDSRTFITHGADGRVSVSDLVRAPGRERVPRELPAVVGSRREKPSEVHMEINQWYADDGGYTGPVDGRPRPFADGSDLHHWPGEVAAVQEILIIDGYYNGPKDGDYDQEVTDAVARYQSDLAAEGYYSGSINGIWDRKTQEAMRRRRWDNYAHSMLRN